MSQKHQKPWLQAENSYFSKFTAEGQGVLRSSENILKSWLLLSASQPLETPDNRHVTISWQADWWAAFKYWCLRVFKASSSLSYFSWLWICIWEWDPWETLASDTQQRRVATLCYLSLTEVGTGIKHELALLTVDCLFPPSPHLPCLEFWDKENHFIFLGELIGGKNQTFKFEFFMELLMGLFFLISGFGYFSQIELFRKVKFIHF